MVLEKTGAEIQWVAGHLEGEEAGKMYAVY